MVRDIVRDVFFLSQKSESAAETAADMAVIRDLKDTLIANADACVGMAANMIGIRKRIIAVNTGLGILIMVNPEITLKEGPYETEEGCLSLLGQRKTVRYETIEVKYQDSNFKPQTGQYKGWIAQIIQHEVDHCNGIII